MGLLFFLIIFIVAFIDDEIGGCKRRAAARNRGYQSYWHHGFRDVNTNQYVDLYQPYEEGMAKIRIEKYLRNKSLYVSYVDFLQKNGFPTLWEDVLMKDMKYWSKYGRIEKE